jgi:hypothetical protein
MKNIPALNVNSQKISTSLPPEDKVARSLEQASEAVADAQASIVSLGRTRSKGKSAEGVEKVLDSLLSQLGDSKSLASAHSGLDPVRVADLLGD